MSIRFDTVRADRQTDGQNYRALHALHADEGVPGAEAPSASEHTAT